MISVLIVDDQPVVGKAVSRMLATEDDMTCHYCDDPRNTFDMARDTSPDLMLVDLSMPQMEGQELIRMLRDDEHTKQIPIIVLSASDDSEEKMEAYANGASDYLVKTPDRLDLIGRIRQLVELAQEPSTREEQQHETIEAAAASEPRDLELSVAPRLPFENLRRQPYLRDAPLAKLAGKVIPTVGGMHLWAQLGSGGMGTVFYGFHPRLKTEVAVKILHPSIAKSKPHWIKRLFREAHLAAKIKSPRLVSVLDVDEEDGLFYMVMEYVHGVSADRHVRIAREQGAIGLTQSQALSTVIAANEGLSAAHGGSAVHRDVKPDNILVPANEERDISYFGMAKLTDLGIAHVEEIDENLTAERTALGTPGYIAPEQFLDAKKVGPAADVFGMGATLFKLLAGRPPFQDETPMKTAMASVHNPHARLEELNPNVSAPIVTLCDRALEKDAEDRFADSIVLGEALQMCMAFVDGDSADERQLVADLKRM